MRRLPPGLAENSQETAKPGGRGPGRPFHPGQSGNPGGRPKGTKTYSVRSLVADALDDPTREAAILKFREVVATPERCVPTLEFAARVNKEIGVGSDQAVVGVAIYINTNLRVGRLKAKLEPAARRARSREP